MLTEDLKKRISRLTWAQFDALVRDLKLDITQFAQGDAPAQRTLNFENQCIAAGNIASTDVEAALNRVLNVTNLEEADREIFKANIDEASRQLQTPSFQNGQNLTLRQQVKRQIDSIRAAKAIHACVQHQIWYKVPECLARARADLSRAKERNAARKTLESVRNDLQNIRRDSAFLRATYHIQLDSLTLAMLSEIDQHLKALGGTTAVDLETTVELTLRPYVSQVPMSMQHLLADESTTIPWQSLAAIGGASFNSIADLLNEQVSQQGAWQSVNDQMVQLTDKDRLAAFFARTNVALRQVKALAGKLVYFSAFVPLANQCGTLARDFEKAVQADSVDEEDIENRIEQIDGLISDQFNNADNRLLNACGELDRLSNNL